MSMIDQHSTIAGLCHLQQSLMCCVDCVTQEINTLYLLSRLTLVCSHMRTTSMIIEIS